MEEKKRDKVAFNVDVQCIGVQQHSLHNQKVMLACGLSIHLSQNVKYMP